MKTIADRYLYLVKLTVMDGALSDLDGDRIDGKVWPERALTMIGAARLENVRTCIEAALSDSVPGDFLEAGVWRGGAAIYARAVLDANGAEGRTVWLADSFAGLPPPDAATYPADAGDGHHTITVLAVPRAEVERNFARLGLLDDRVKFIEGWFRDTLPTAAVERIAVLRLDGDMYGSTWETLDALYPRVSVGGFVIVDDYVSHPTQCGAAVRDYRATNGIDDPLLPIDWTGVYWRRSK